MGSGTVESVPTIIDPTYSLGLVGAVEVGSGYPGPSLGPAPSPLALATNSLEPVTATSLAYQQVGIDPRTWPLAASITSTSLLPEFATYRVCRSGDRVSPVGLVPTSAFA